MTSKNGYIFTSSFPPEDNETIKRCLSSWKKYTNNIILIQPPSEVEKVKLYYHGTEIIKTSTEPKSFAWSKPYCPNIMDFIQLTEYSDVVIINSDIYLNYSPEEWNSEWELKNNKSFICGIRTNYDEDSNIFAFEPYGLDIFKLPKGTFNYFKNLHSEYLIGHPGWDYWLFYKLIEFGFDCEYKFNTKIIHKMHSLNWSETDSDYAKTLFDPVLFKKEKKELSLSDHFILLQNFIQSKTERSEWSSFNSLSKTLKYISCASNDINFNSINLNISSLVFICFGSAYVFLINNINQILNNFNLNYFNPRLVKSLNKTTEEILLECATPFVLIPNTDLLQEQNIEPTFPKKYFFIQNPLDILVSIYLDFINNSEKTNFNIDSKLQMLFLPINKDKYKNMSIDAYVKDMAPLLNENLLRLVGIIKNSDLKNCHIIYYENIINNENELFLVLEKILKQVYGKNSSHNLKNFLPLLKWPINFFNKESSQPGYYKKVLRKETINELNIIFKEFNDNFYTPDNE